MDFDKDLRMEILKYLPHNKKDAGTCRALMAMDMGCLIAVFLNWLSRLVHPRPRTVLMSNEILQNPSYLDYKYETSILLDKISCGDDLGPFLSERVQLGFVLNKGKKAKNLYRREDLDLLLNDWGIHHLHFFDSKKRKNNSRDNLLLFVMFTQSHAYILDLAPHGCWTRQRFVEIAVRNWPDKDLFFYINGILSSAPSISDEKRKEYRGLCVNTLIDIDGKTYFPATGGLMTSGLSSKIFRATNDAKDFLKELVKQYYQDQFFSFFRQANKPYPLRPEFSLKIRSNHTGCFLAVYEKTTGAVFDVWNFLT